MARRTLNRKELRADYAAAERRKTEEEDELDEETDEDEEDEEEEEAEGEDETGEDEEDEEDDVPKKKKKLAAKHAKPRSRTRSAKVVRMKVVWGVFNNSNQQVATFEYSQRKLADEKAAQLTADKKQTHFVQPVKKEMEEKKEKEKKEKD